jgi:hypothetical protein
VPPVKLAPSIEGEGEEKGGEDGGTRAIAKLKRMPTALACGNCAEKYGCQFI